MADQRRIFDDQLYAHFVTFSVDRRRRLLNHDHPKRILLGVLGEELELHHASLIGFVIMPDHVHALVWFPETGKLSGFMHGWKRKSSFHIRNWYDAEAPNYGLKTGATERFWTPKYHSFEIYEMAKLEEKLNYMHENPVRRGLVQRTTDWKWSSARWYVWHMTVGVPISWVE